MSEGGKPVLGRRGLLAGLGAAAALPAMPAFANSDVKLTIIYVGAKDCGPCQVFNVQDRPQWDRSGYPRNVRFITIDAPKTTVAYNARYWPSDVRFVLPQIKVPVVPTFILLDGRTIVKIGTGVGGWRAQIMPQIPGMLTGEWFRGYQRLQ